jgi:hypothetical protein
MKRSMLLLVLIACCSGKQQSDLKSKAPFGRLEPSRLVRLFSACGTPLRIEDERLVTAMICEDGRSASGTRAISWRLQTTMDGRFTLVELQGANDAILQEEAARLLPILASRASSTLLASIDASTGTTTEFEGLKIDIYRDFRGHILNQPWRLLIRWDINLGV